MALREHRGTRALLDAVSWILAVGMRLLLRLPDRVLLFLLAAAERGARWIGIDATAELGDLRGILRDDPAASRVLHRMFLDSPITEVRALLRGALHHQLGAAPAASPRICVAAVPSTARGAATPRLTVGVAVAGPELGTWCAAYAANRGCEPQPVATGRELPAGIGALELAAAPQVAERLALEALKAGVAVSIHHGSIASAAVLERLLAAADAAAVPLRVFYPLLYYPPVQRMKQLLDAGDIGVPSSIRVRATLAGRGGRAAPPWPEPEDYLGHPAFDHFLLLLHLGGNVARVCAYLHPITATAGGQGLVSVEYQAPARLGVLECTGAPELYLSSNFYPYDLEAEVAGTDGVAFLQRGMSRRIGAAPLFVRAGRRAQPIGVAAGLPDAWAEVYAGAAAEYCTALRNGKPPGLGRQWLRAAWQLRDTARRAARCAAALEV